MSEFSNLTGRFRIHKENNPSPVKATKRARESLVCNSWRKAKLRCDRQQLCGSCIRRDEGELCSYQRPQVHSHPTTTEDRLAHLESLVKELHVLHSEPGPTDNDGVAGNDSLADPQIPDHTPIDSFDKTLYVGSTHWSAILDDIHELKAALNRQVDPQAVGESTAIDSSAPYNESIIFGSTESYSLKRNLSQYLPPKEEMDRFLAVYFRGERFIIPFIHTFQFQRQYQAFWGDPIETNPLWLSILFSISAGKSLVKGEYHRPQPLVLEALTIYAQCKNMQSLDPSREAGTILAMTVRTAYEMGYHRDPESLGSFTFFESEMRRRFWALLKQADLMVSFQLGLPSNICLENCDTKSPRNLSDADFDVDTETIPQSRPENEYNGLIWFIFKDRQMVSFSAACREALSFDEKSETQIVELDSEIRRVHSKIPIVLRARPMADSITDPPFLIMVRIYVEFIYLKSLCVLHRKYMSWGNVISTSSCIEAGQRIVSQFITIYREFAPGGQLHQERWMLTNFTMNDFLMGVMVLCLVVHIRRRNRSQQAISSGIEGSILPLLKQAHDICLEKSSVSRDAGCVARAVKVILEDPSGRENIAALPVENAWQDGVSLGWLDPFYSEEIQIDWGLFDSLVSQDAIEMQ
ncbi:hypothetical protein N7493_002149 [Penicillium malachiteum]|uniref:Zn(2)-C6 fungal-type domain-containing protein n=1 Tax=Penicillium malachiteum TaxID=1324776 RepID=A0AAD6MYC4_9EURO|nr:hypothetical protein N7493_002149 [Penicillium malachiteum]